ncbi:Adenomatous polyposis coli protein [Geodia barretti]|uniref:Adenomatous polyposis coli protein n=1 Tax=Geodia barretti TaxID=519541 RepID=A0AA35WT95_GEOBA|nr:Adenomatous polyposis coli protein [Geodia barretti]
MSVYGVRTRGPKRHSHSHRPPQSTQNHIAQLQQEKAQILHHSAKMEHLKKNYVNQLTNALRDQQKYTPGSQEFQEVHRLVKHIVQDMHAQIGTPEDCNVREHAEREKLLEIEEQLKAFKHSRFKPLSSPENSQVSGRDGSSQWSSPPLSHNSDENSLLTEMHNPSSHHHSAMTQSQNESGFCEVDSDVTASSHHRSKQIHSPNSTEFLTYSSDLSGTTAPVLRYYNMQRSASVEDTSAQDQEGPADVLAALIKNTPQLHRSNAKYRTATSLSQDTYSSEFRPPFIGHPPNSISLSQSSARAYPPYYRKPGSPASSSDTSSMTSSVAHRLGSGPGSMVSFTTDSSTRSNTTNKGLLPRPPSLASTSGSAPSVLSKPGYPSFGEFSQRSRSEYSFPSYTPSLATTYDSDNDEDPPAIKPSPKHSRDGGPMGRRQNVQLRKQHKDGSPMEVYGRRREGKRMQPNQPRIPEEGSERDSFTMKLEMVLSVLSLVLNNKDQTDADAARMLLALSQSPETCSVMRQSACMNMLIQIMHNIDRKGEKSHREVRAKAAEALRNIVESTDKTRQGKHELCVLAVLEKIRGHCDAIFEFIHSIPSTRKVEASERELLQNSCEFLIQPMRKLYKYSNEKDHYRPAVLTLGGLQATAELLVVNFRLMTSQKPGTATEKPVCHSTKTIAFAISILVNLTHGDIHNKSALCMFPDLLKALMHHLRLKQETLITSGAQLLRNLSWKATADIKDSLLKCDAAIVLIEALRYVSDEQTIQHITSALWNLSAHSMENRDKICTTDTGLKQLVELLSYNSPTGTPVVVENIGGILKNLSVVIMQQEEYRKKFRRSGGLGKLVQHLKSKNKTVLANATGTLWNLSARFPEDQKTLWDLGCVPLLDVLQTAHHKNIAEYARGALRNLLAFGRSNGWTSKSDVTAYNIKTQRELSKSLCYAANQVFNHPSSQGKHSNESLHSRRSQPAKTLGSDGPLDQMRLSNEQITSGGSMRDSARTLRGCDSKDGGDGDSSGEEYVQMERNRLKFNRVASVPETVRNHKENEWSSYMPGSHGPSGKQSLFMASQGFPGEKVVDVRRKKTSQGVIRVKDQTGLRSLSQSESYHLSSTSNSDGHSGSGASFCMPQQLSNEPGETASAILPYSDLSHSTRHGGPVMYSADLEVDDEESDSIDQPLPIHRKQSDGGYHPRNLGNRGMGMVPKSPSIGGTINLALDGLLHGDSTKVTSV